MSISVQCSCGKLEDVPDIFAGKYVRCRACGARIKIGIPPVASAAHETGAGSTLSYSSPNRGNVVISRERMLAGRSCFCWGGLMLAMASCVGLALLVILGRPFGASGLALVSNGAVLAILLACAATYIVSGIQIRRGGMVCVIVCLVLASIHLLFSGCLTALYFLAALTRNPIAFFAFPVSLLAAAAFGQLDYYLIRILRQPRLPV